MLVRSSPVRSNIGSNVLAWICKDVNIAVPVMLHELELTTIPHTAPSTYRVYMRLIYLLSVVLFVSVALGSHRDADERLAHARITIIYGTHHTHARL